MSGDCFPVAGAAILVAPTTTARLVHARPVYRGAPGFADGVRVEPGDRYWHAWIEDRGWVFDFSNGREFVVAVGDWYAVGELDESQVTRYTANQAGLLMLLFGHYGPWR